MARFNNQVRLTGRVGQSPEPHYLTDGTLVTRLKLYVASIRHEDGRPEKDDCFALVAWEKVAQRISETVYKGCSISIQGQLRNRRFKRDGQTHIRTEIHVDHFQQLSGPKARA